MHLSVVKEDQLDSGLSKDVSTPKGGSSVEFLELLSKEVFSVLWHPFYRRPNVDGQKGVIWRGLSALSFGV